MDFSPVQPKILDLNRCLNAITDIVRQNRSLPSLFIDFWNLNPLHGGSGGHLGGLFEGKMDYSPVQPNIVDLSRCLKAINRLIALDYIPPESFDVFLTFDSAHQGVRRSFTRLRRHQVDLSFYGRDRSYFFEKGKNNNTHLVYEILTGAENIIFHN